jgi:hypothetical protein
MDLYSKVIEENMDKGYQVRLAASEFRETVYLHLRKYFLSYEGEWVASKEGVSVPASLDNVYALLDGLFEICANAEGYEIIRKYAEKLIDNSQVE